jgi:hypothetical protein
MPFVGPLSLLISPHFWSLSSIDLPPLSVPLLALNQPRWLVALAVALSLSLSRLADFDDGRSLLIPADLNLMTVRHTTPRQAYETLQKSLMVEKIAFP